MIRITGLTEFTHLIIGHYVKENDIAVDATAGNGYDTIFLAEKVGNNGKVYSFDIQKDALKRTKIKIDELFLNNRVILINDSHDKMDFFIKNKISCCMFNLGYLPSSDRNICTKSHITIAAIQKAIVLLKKDGIISIISYSEHKGGLNETEQIEDFLKNVKNIKLNILKIETLSDKKNSPKIFLIQK